MQTQIDGFELMELGFPQGTIIGIALKINRGRHGLNRVQMMASYAAVLASPESYIEDKIFGKLALALIEKANEKPEDFIALNPSPNAFSAYGLEQIEEGARDQMRVAM